jgi:hypothetical protein
MGMAQDMVISKELSYLAELSIGMFDDASYSVTSIPNSISIRQNRFWLVSSEGRSPTPNPLKLHFVTLGVKAPEGRTYYEGAYDPENSGPPDCFSYDGVTPDAQGPKRQADTCGTCKQSMWGSSTSKLTGAMIPACRAHKDVVIKVMGVEGMWLLRVPPASIRKQWAPLIAQIKKVAEKEQAKHGKASLTMLTCVVEATFDDTQQGVLNFKPMGYLSQSEAPAVTALARDNEAVLQALWGPEGSTRAARWSSPKNELVAQNKEVIEPPKKEIVKKSEPRITKIETTTQKPLEKTISNVTEPVGDEVDSILKSMGVFDG